MECNDVKHGLRVRTTKLEETTGMIVSPCARSADEFMKEQRLRDLNPTPEPIRHEAMMSNFVRVYDATCTEAKWSVLDQAVEMGMHIVNNRKRMRKRMRQYRKLWHGVMDAIYAEYEKDQAK